MVDTVVGSSSVQDGVAEGMPTPAPPVDPSKSVCPKNYVRPKKMERRGRAYTR